MAKLITRTFIENLATVKVVSTITDEVTTIKVIIPVSKNTVEKAERFLNKNLIYDEYKCISVLELTAEETLRGITEEQFLDLSVILDKETRKPIELVDENIMPLPERE